MAERSRKVGESEIAYFHPKSDMVFLHGANVWAPVHAGLILQRPRQVYFRGGPSSRNPLASRAVLATALDARSTVAHVIAAASGFKSSLLAAAGGKGA